MKLFCAFFLVVIMAIFKVSVQSSQCDSGADLSSDYCLADIVIVATHDSWVGQEGNDQKDKFQVDVVSKNVEGPGAVSEGSSIDITLLNGVTAPCPYTTEQMVLFISKTSTNEYHLWDCFSVWKYSTECMNTDDFDNYKNNPPLCFK